MAQKVKPHAFRLGITVPWSNRWFFRRSLRYFIEEDYAIRTLIESRLKEAGIASIDIERTGDTVRVNIRASRPGFVIGRGGKGIDTLRVTVAEAVEALRKVNGVTKRVALALNVEELKRTEVSSAVVGQTIAAEIEKRKPYRMVMKRAIENVMQNHDVKGAKVKISGRLNGAEISRSDWLAKGRMPLQSLRAHIDYSEATAFNTYGTVGIKVWIYKGDIFTERKNSDDRNEK